MNKLSIGIGASLLLLLAAIGVGQGIVYRTIVPPDARRGLSRATLDRLNGVPRTPREIARAQRELAEAFRYKGTTALAGRGTDPDDERVQKVCALLAKADFIPARRVQRYSGLDPRITVVGWHLTVERLDVREHDSLVRVRAHPQLRAHGEGEIMCSTSYHEDYRVFGGQIQFVSGEPLPQDMSISLSRE